MMKNKASRKNSNETPSKEKVPIYLPASLYHSLRRQAQQQQVSLSEFLQKKINQLPASKSPSSPNPALARLPLKELLVQTTPVDFSSDSRLDFFSSKR